LFETHNDPALDSSTRWQDVNEIFQKHPSWETADQIDRLVAFEEFIREIDRKEFNSRRKERMRKQRKRREEFSALMRDLIQKRRVTF